MSSVKYQAGMTTKIHPEGAEVAAVDGGKWPFEWPIEKARSDARGGGGSIV